MAPGNGTAGDAELGGLPGMKGGGGPGGGRSVAELGMAAQL